MPAQMFQIATFEGWSDLARDMFDEGGRVDLWIAVFFCTYIVIVSWMLLPIVVALLLDNFSNMAASEQVHTLPL